MDTVWYIHVKEYYSVVKRMKYWNTEVQKKADTKGHILYDFTDRKCPEKVNSQRQKVDWWLSGAEGKMRGDRKKKSRVSLWGDKNFSGISGDGCTTLWMCYKTLKCPFENCQFYVISIISQKTPNPSVYHVKNSLEGTMNIRWEPLGNLW
jgi:hypothetical protein